MTPVRPLDRAAVALMLLLCVTWGFTQITSKYALAEIPPLTQAALRSAVGSVLFGAFAADNLCYFQMNGGAVLDEQRCS